MVYFKQIKNAFWLLTLLFAFGFVVRFYSFKHVELLNDNTGISWYKWIYYPTWSRLDGLLTGISIAALIQFKPQFSKKILRHGNVLFILSALLFVVDYFFCSETESFNASMFGFPLADFGYGFIVLAALSPQCFLYKYKSKITAKIATLSYGIYLIHKIIIHVVQNQLMQIKISEDGNLMFLICVVIVFIASFALNETIEKPFLKLRKKILLKNSAN